MARVLIFWRSFLRRVVSCFVLFFRGMSYVCVHSSAMSYFFVFSEIGVINSELRHNKLVFMIGLHFLEAIWSGRPPERMTLVCDFHSFGRL